MVIGFIFVSHSLYVTFSILFLHGNKCFGSLNMYEQ